MNKLLLAALITVCAPAYACETVEVNVLPITVTTHFDKSAAQITDLSEGIGYYGFTSAQKGFGIEGCKVTVGWMNVELYVARELLSDQCSFEHVLKHENEHVAIYQRNLDGIAAALQGQTPTKALIIAEMNKARAFHVEHDSPEEYHLNVTACFGNIAKLAGKGRRS